jgi:rhamnosyltransferase
MSINKTKIIAVIVSYNDGKSILENISTLMSQVDHILVFDNDSDDKTIKILEEIDSNKVEIIYFNGNKGIAAALNAGVKVALENNYDYILTMDQDSIANQDMVKYLEKCLTSDDLIMVAGPSFKNNNVQKDFAYKNSLITSGNLVKAKVFIDICNYDEYMFIDSVDFDFSLKIINAGYSLVQSNRAILNHKLGEKIEYNLLGIKYTYTKHSSLRRYYMFRNHLILIKKYFFTNTIFIIKKSILELIYVIEILIFDKYKLSNIKAIFTGIKDGIFKKHTL